MPASAQELRLSFDAARLQLEQRSPAIQAAGHAEAAAKETAAAVKTLRRPIVTASAQYLEYQKTLSVDLTGPRDAALDRTQGFLADLPGMLPPGFQEIATQITGRINQALPGLFSLVPDTLSYRYRDDVFRPTVQAALPLYTGGAIPAIQRGAQAGVTLAGARSEQARELAQINLIRVYFGQIAAVSLVNSTRESRDALDRLLADARKLEAAGVIPHATTLQAQVARDTAERAYRRAVLEADSARAELAQVLDAEQVVPTTPLFVASRPLDPVPGFLGRESGTVAARQADAARDVAAAGVDLARSRYRPQAFAFGEYNLNRDDALPTEPDWIVGVGVRYTLLSNIDRGHTLAAARENLAAAEAASREARKTSTTATLRAWNLVEAARQSFLLLDSSLAATTENLRVQQVSFREGEGTLTAVLAAEASLASARTQRVAVAYEYDLALAGLLAASGRLSEFSDHLSRADIRVQAPAEVQP